MGSFVPSPSNSPPNATFFLDPSGWPSAPGLFSAEELWIGRGSDVPGRESTCSTSRFGAAPGILGSEFRWSLVPPWAPAGGSGDAAREAGTEAVPALVLAPSDSQSGSWPIALRFAFTRSLLTCFRFLTKPGCSQYGVMASLTGRSASLTGFNFWSTCAAHRVTGPGHRTVDAKSPLPADLQLVDTSCLHATANAETVDRGPADAPSLICPSPR